MGNPDVTIFVNVSTGAISGQDHNDQWLKAGDTFAWITSVVQDPVTVTAQHMTAPYSGPWFTPYDDPDGDSVSFKGPATGQLADNSNVAVVASDEISPPSGWSYVPNIPTSAGRVVVKSSGQDVRPVRKAG